ncbi:peptidylprolyl isomerase [Virgibacillus oceani]|uniref:peptidylprolyl isomerase n=1 Tax=Virgibacillus oceani TaxID=1479511 RepID=A0A917HKK0_9BACI|nr:peptidylprolyl isomerase [Virgibacillus oceani]GGG81943.1 hypothetical protein GCM10011398_29260 [Virgibacillus oceani]
MSKKLLLSVIVVLLITNVATLLFWNKDDEKIVVDEGNAKIDAKKPVATIEGQEISYKDWMDKLREAHGQNQLEKMIDHEIVTQLAEKNNIEVSEKVIDRELSLLTGMQGPMSEEEAEKKAKKWRKDVIYRYQLASLLTMDTSVPEEEMRTYFNDYQNQYNFTASLKLSHIIVPDFDTAEKVEKELDKGASFQLLAQEYSIDEDTKKDGGYLGYFTNNSQFLPTGYRETALEMKERSYSEPFKSDTGIAIIYLHAKLPDIEFTYDEIKPYIESELALEEQKQSLSAKALWDKLDVEWIYE